jgi:hypothetical protein
VHTRGGLPVVYADRYYKHGGKDGEPRLLMAQACFLQNGVANATKISRAVARRIRRSSSAVHN